MYQSSELACAVRRVSVPKEGDAPAHRELNAKAAEGGRGPETSLLLPIGSEQHPDENAF